MHNLTNRDNNDLLNYLIEHGDIGLYDCLEKDFPAILMRKKFGQIRIFSRKLKKETASPDNFSFHIYKNIADIHHSDDEVCFLDKKSVRALFIRLPTRPKYILVRLRPRASWILGIPGLLRRIVRGQVKIEGVRKIPARGKSRKWLVLKISNSKLRASFTLSEKVGVQGFLDYLREENIDYVILRFFEKLPRLHRKDGDLDMLVSDKDLPRVTDFLERRRGSIKIDMWSVSGLQHSDAPYYPPPIARKILDSARQGPAGSRIPAPKELFLSFTYHVLYHKGAEAGVPSTTPNVTASHNSKSDYAGILQKMAKDANIDVDINMEALDEYLDNEGWRPRIDSLARIAGWNKWVKQRFFSRANVKEMGLGVFIVKEKAFQQGLFHPILDAIKKERFHIVRHKRLSDKERKVVADSLRGGNWYDGGGPGKETLFFPRAAIIVLDLHFLYMKSKHMGSGTYHGISLLKKRMRSKFDDEKFGSFIHSTDNTNEAWEYARVCFPKEMESIRKTVDDLHKKFTPSFFQKISLFLKSTTYNRIMFTSKIKELIIRRLIK